jgi:hypothetical protein
MLLNNISEIATDQNVSSEVTQEVSISLVSVPPIVKSNNIHYQLRRICSHTHGLSGQRNNLEHYRIYCKRNCGNNWESYDDQRIKSISINSKIKVSYEIILHSI